MLAWLDESVDCLIAWSFELAGRSVAWLAGSLELASPGCPTPPGVINSDAHSAISLMSWSVGFWLILSSVFERSEVFAFGFSSLLDLGARMMRFLRVFHF